MEKHLMEHCQAHFKQAHGSPYTVPPLSTLLNYDSLTPFGQQISRGTANLQDIKISHHTKLLLRHQRAWPQSHLPRFYNLMFEGMVNGFRRWPECTSTSPSGRHLGIYKSLAKDINRSKRQQKTTTTTKENNQTPREPVYDGKHVLHLIHQLITMAVKHCHTFDRWRVIWNLFIEKEIGIPRINKLRTLHIVKADYNLLLKWYGPKGFMQRAEDHNQLTPYQGGGQWGRSAIDLACKKVAAYDYVMIT